MSSLANSNGLDDKLLQLSAAMDAFEGYAPGQASRVAWAADALAEKFGIAHRDREFLQHAASLHDIGEVRMNRDYLRANRALSISERLDLERHPIIGEQESAKHDLPKSVQLLIRWHHEWWNGDGYPDRLQAEQIPLSARILRVADAYCSLTAERPWRAAMADGEARQQLVLGAGHEFDPSIVYAFSEIQLPAAAEANTAADAGIFSSFGR